MKSGITVQGTNPMAIQKLHEAVQGIIDSANSDQVKVAGLEVLLKADLSPSNTTISNNTIGDNHDDTHA